MENPTVTELRSRSRSKTPFLRSSCDRENCTEGEDHTHHKSGRKTPLRRSTPVKQLQSTNKVSSTEPIIEIDDDEEPPAHRTRKSTRAERTDKVKSSDYSENTEKGHHKEIFQNEINSRYERVATTSRSYSSFADVTLSPIHTQYNVTQDRSTRFGSPAYSACSTDSSFAEQALADTSALLDRDPNAEHLPYRLYKMAGEYWNKYPKTDYTYSPLSKDRVELAPGQVAVPNMSRRSLSQFRIQGPNTTVDEVDRLATATWQTKSVRKRYTAIDSSDDEGSYVRGNGGYHQADQRWFLTRLLMAIVTTITTTTSSAYRKIVGPSHRYPYTDRRPAQAGIVSRTASVAAAPFYWIYSIIKTVITTTVTTVTETITSNHVSESEKYSRSSQVKVAKRRWWPWLLLLLLPAVGYGSHYTYENWDSLAMPNFTDFQLDLSEFTAMELPRLALPNITLPNLNIIPINLTMPDINITLPDIRDNLPEVTKTYREYRDIVQNRMADASEYAKVVAESCFEEIRRYWHGIIG